MATIGSIGVQVFARTSNFEKGMKRAQGVVLSFQSRLQRLSIGIAGINQGFQLAGRVIRGIFGPFQEAIDFADRLAKTSRFLGILPKDFAALQHAADLTGIPIQTFERGMQNLISVLGEFATLGTGEAKRALEAMNIDIKRLTARPAIEQLEEIINRLNQLPDAQRQAFGRMLFGQRAARIMEVTADTIKQARMDVQDFGLALEAFQFLKIEKLKDAFTRLRAAWLGFRVQIVASLAPVLEKLIGILIEFRKRLGDPGELIKAALIGVASIVDHIVEGFREIKRFIGQLLRALDSKGWGKFFSLDLHTLAESLDPSVLRRPKGWVPPPTFTERMMRFLEAADENARAIVGATRIIAGNVASTIGETVQRLGQQVSPAFQAVGVSSPARVQRVFDPQLGRMTSVLMAIERNTKKATGSTAQ